ncbi:MAG: flagellar assembly protein FliH [Rhodocyclaceae bacterium]|nr:MAG: flagellar assembly protein FliH [Rhodocyclaceae bacterium]
MEEKNNLTAWERWELASLEEGAPPKPHPLRAKVAKEEIPPPPEIQLPTAEEIEQIHRQAHDAGYQEGFQAGRQAGLDAGQREGKAQGEQAAQQLLATAAKLDAALAGLDQAVTDELAALALEIAREVLRQTLALQPETVVGVVRDALTHLPHQHANIYLHPDDAALVRSYAGDQLSHAGHRIHEDDRLQRNDVLIEASGAQVDAKLASRWRRVVETLGQQVAWDGTPPIRKEEPAPAAEDSPAVDEPPPLS